MDKKKTESSNAEKEKKANSFSFIYSKEHQDKFIFETIRGDFETALAILEQMPKGDSSAKKIERLIILVEGYKMISKIFHNRHKKSEIEKEFFNLKKKLFYYENIGSPDELIHKLSLLEKYMEIGSPEQINKDLIDYYNLRTRLK